MKILYLDCGMGAAGDMLLAALAALLPDPNAFVARLNALGLPGVEYALRPVSKCGIAASHMEVRVHGQQEHSHDAAHCHPHGQAHTHADAAPHSHDHDAPHDHPHTHHHTALGDIRAMIDALPVPAAVRGNAKEVYRLLAGAEAAVHGVQDVELVHFHEVGALDAVADIVGVCLAMAELAPDQVIVSTIRTGYGQVRCAHGVLPVPAPATAALLCGMPAEAGAIEGELCTPTGAALVKHFATGFGTMPAMRATALGYGAGMKDFAAANLLRATLGEAQATPEGPNETVTELCCNLDDMTGEALAHAAGALLDAGALDAYLVPIQMKKCRPGQMLCCLCRPADADRLAALMLRHTTTLGVRRRELARYALARSEAAVGTPYGPVRVKTAEGYGVRREKPACDDLARIASAQGIPLDEARLRVVAPRHTADE